MSDFDKEAEREKLREKFEAEEERRETTQQMSELLLKGATMLNVHCADCAAPVFRHNGEEFCPTCQRPVEELTTAGPGDLTGPGGPTSSTPGEAPSNGADAAESPEAAGAAEIDVDTPERAAGSPADPEAADTEPEPETPDAQPTDATPAEATEAAGADEPSRQPEPTPSTAFDASQDSAVESLSAAISRLSERAAAADDPRQAQELLAAANEAAEVLQRLRD